MFSQAFHYFYIYLLTLITWGEFLFDIRLLFFQSNTLRLLGHTSHHYSYLVLYENGWMIREVHFPCFLMYLQSFLMVIEKVLPVNGVSGVFFIRQIRTSWLFLMLPKKRLSLKRFIFIYHDSTQLLNCNCIKYIVCNCTVNCVDQFLITYKRMLKELWNFNRKLFCACHKNRVKQNQYFELLHF